MILKDNYFFILFVHSTIILKYITRMVHE